MENGKEVFDSDYIIEFALVGYTKAGKTSIVSRYFDGIFQEQLESTFLFKRREQIIEIDQYSVHAIILDLSGMKFFINKNLSYSHNTNCFIFVYDCQSKESFDNLIKMMDQYFEEPLSNKVKAIVAIIR